MKKLDLQIDETCGNCQRFLGRIQEIQATQHTERKGAMDDKKRLWVTVVISPEYNHAGKISCWHIESVREKKATP